MKFYNLFIIILLFAGTYYAQNLNAQKDSLQVYRDQLKSSIEQTKKDIAELRKIYDSLGIKIKDSQRDLYILKYGEEVGGQVAMGQIWEGMTKEMMIDSWGEPDKKNTDEFSYGTFTQFYYGDITYFFRDGKLIEWEEDKDGKRK